MYENVRVMDTKAISAEFKISVSHNYHTYSTIWGARDTKNILWMLMPQILAYVAPMHVSHSMTTGRNPVGAAELTGTCIVLQKKKSAFTQQQQKVMM